jgi:hypothetical protein
MTLAATQADSENKAFNFSTPAGVSELEVIAELKYQKADAAFMDRLFGEEAGLRTPITNITRESIRIPIMEKSVSRLKQTEMDEQTVGQ